MYICILYVMSVRMYVCMNVMPVCMYEGMYVCMYVHSASVCINIHIHRYLCRCMECLIKNCIYMQKCKHTHTHTYICVYMYTYIFLYIYIYIYVCGRIHL